MSEDSLPAPEEGRLSTVESPGEERTESPSQQPLFQYTSTTEQEDDQSDDDEDGTPLLKEIRKTQKSFHQVGYHYETSPERTTEDLETPLQHLVSHYKFEEEEDKRSSDVSEGDEYSEGWNLSDVFGSEQPSREGSQASSQKVGEFFHKFDDRSSADTDTKRDSSGSDGFSYGSSDHPTSGTGEEDMPVFDFDKECMNISEDEARERLDKWAEDPEKKRDEILKYYPEPGEIGILPTDPEYQSEATPVLDRCPSIESFFRLKKSIDVHFYLYPGGKMISRDCRLDATVHQLKSAIAHFVRVPADYLDLRRKRNLVADNRTLLELGAGPKTKMKFTVEINKRIPGSFQIQLPKDKEVLQPREEVRSVVVTNEEGEHYTLQVLISYSTEPKPKLGGYMDSRTGQRFLHAQTSTNTIDVEEWEASDKHKAAQTFNEKHHSTQTSQDVGQQMEREDYYVSRTRDRVIRAKKYRSFAEMEKVRGAAIITIQRYWRGWLARQERKKRLEGLIMRIQWAEKIRKGRIDQRYQIMEDEIKRQENPQRMVDIELLYRAINYWRKEQEEYVMKNRWGAERKAALAILTEMEADLLLDLERTRKRIKEEGRENMIECQFNKMGKPKRWLGSKTDTFITMDTKERLNVRQLHHTYRDLKAPVVDDSKGEGEEEEVSEGSEAKKATESFTLKERLELLGRVNEMIKGVTSRLGVMLSDLITRELTYIRIHVSKKLLVSLRKRISNCFFLLCQDPTFNPEAKRIQKVPFDYNKLRKDMVQCKGCRRMQYRDEFTIERGTTVTTRCHTCMGLYRTAILRVDLNLYRHMLDELRKDELAAGVSNSVTFLIDAFDLQFLVEQIWHGQSALSGIDKKYLLRLCRWIRGEPWTPWNCVLLTEEEAVSHLQLGNMKDAYRDTFFHKVFVKQCTAKTYFEGLAKLALGLDDRIKEGCVRLKEKEKHMRLAKEKFKKKARILKYIATAS